MFGSQKAGAKQGTPLTWGYLSRGAALRLRTPPSAPWAAARRLQAPVCNQQVSTSAELYTKMVMETCKVQMSHSHQNSGVQDGARAPLLTTLRRQEA